MCTKAEAIHILRQVKDGCERIYPGVIRDAWLYGSFARGDQHEGSDVDILLTADLTDTEIARRRGALAHLSSELSLAHDVTVSVTVKPLAQFQRFSSAMPYYRAVVQEGIRL